MAEDAPVEPLAGEVVRSGLSGVENARRALAEARQRHPPAATPTAAAPKAEPAEPAPKAAPVPAPAEAVDLDRGGDPADTLTADGALLQMVQGQLREQLERALAERDARIGRLEGENARLRDELAVVAEAVARAMRPAAGPSS